MPELRLEKARATLPSGYQFGDASRLTITLREGVMGARAEYIERDGSYGIAVFPDPIVPR